MRVTYLLPAPAAPLVKDYVVGPQSRFNIWVDDEGRTDPALARARRTRNCRPSSSPPTACRSSPSARCTSNQPGRPLGAGHESAGVTAPATQWFLAEGATGDYFDLFILIANPQADAGRPCRPTSCSRTAR